MSNPLADQMRPQDIKDMVGQSHLLSDDSVFLRVIEKGKVPNMIFYGPSGTGKTTAANIIAKKSNLQIYKLNGTTASTDDIKAVIAEIHSMFNDKGILLYLDEIQYLNKKQQQSLLEFVENGDITLIASTTENPYFYIYPALLSRCTVFEFKPISIDDIKLGLQRIVKKIKAKVDDDALDLLAVSSNGDMRKAINNLEFVVSSLKNKQETVDLAKVKQLIIKANIAYDRSEDKHFDNLSALMKSLRGSDPDAALFYLAKMLSAGDLIAACRRIMCSVSEDVGLAYPQLIPIVKSCVDMALQLGMPEARLPLANAVILIATAPKSNSAHDGINAAMQMVEQGKGIEVPRCLQNTHFDGEDAKVKGQNYLYPHDYPNHYVKQQYLPDDIKQAVFYQYGDNKFEKTLKEYWDKVKK